MKSQDFITRAQGLLGVYRSKVPCASLFVGRLSSEEPPYEAHVGARGFYDLASLTKALVTAPLVATTFAEAQTAGDVDPTLPDQLAKLSIDDLLTHRSGLPWWTNFWLQNHPFPETVTREDRRRIVLERIMETCRYGRCELSPRYSDLGYLLLGVLLETASQRRLNDLFQGTLSQLQVTSELTFNPRGQEAIPTAYCPIQSVRLQGVVHDENSRVLGRETGHAGLFGRGQDIWSWLETVANHALWAEWRAHGWRGWQKSQDFVSAPQSREMVGHLGFTGTSFWVCPETQRAVVFLSNRVYAERQSKWMTDLRRQVSELAEEAFLFC